MTRLALAAALLALAGCSHDFAAPERSYERQLDAARRLNPGLWAECAARGWPGLCRAHFCAGPIYPAGHPLACECFPLRSCSNRI